MSTAIPLWIAFAVAYIARFIAAVVSHVYRETDPRKSKIAVLLTLVLFLACISLFISAVVFTVREENSRHESGEHGLGPAGITSILFGLVLIVLVEFVTIFT